MSIALVLSTAFVTTAHDSPNRDVRIEQYRNGLEQVAALSREHPALDVFSVDNTVEDAGGLDPEIAAAVGRIPGLKDTLWFWDNELGRKSRSAGSIIQWQRIAPRLARDYEYTVHYEPRLRLTSESFFDTVERNPGAYFRSETEAVRRHKSLWRFGFLSNRSRVFNFFPFFTGLFSLRTADLEAYARSVDPAAMVEREECVEIGLYRFVRRRRIPYTLVSTLGVLWNDAAADNWVAY